MQCRILTAKWNCENIYIKARPHAKAYKCHAQLLHRKTAFDASGVQWQLTFASCLSVSLWRVAVKFPSWEFCMKVLGRSWKKSVINSIGSALRVVCHVSERLGLHIAYIIFLSFSNELLTKKMLACIISHRRENTSTYCQVAQYTHAQKILTWLQSLELVCIKFFPVSNDSRHALGL